MIDLEALRNVGNLHEFAVLFGFDWEDPDWDWTWHDVAVKMADEIEAWNGQAERTCKMFVPIDKTIPLRKCSACREQVKKQDNLHYCPNCGAKVVK